MNYRRKRAAFSEEEVEGEEEVENPLAKFTMPEVVSVFKSVKVLREAYNNLMESYSNYKNQKALETDEEEEEDAENEENENKENEDGESEDVENGDEEPEDKEQIENEDGIHNKV